MSDDTGERLIKPPVVVESYGDLDGKSRSAIRQGAATGHVEVLANRVRELCAAFDELDADGLGDDAQEALWRAYDSIMATDHDDTTGTRTSETRRRLEQTPPPRRRPTPPSQSRSCPLTR